jgi:hypothetical protein
VGGGGYFSHIFCCQLDNHELRQNVCHWQEPFSSSYHRLHRNQCQTPPNVAAQCAHDGSVERVNQSTTSDEALDVMFFHIVACSLRLRSVQTRWRGGGPSNTVAFDESRHHCGVGVRGGLEGSTSTVPANFRHSTPAVTLCLTEPLRREPDRVREMPDSFAGRTRVDGCARVRKGSACWCEQ